MSAFESHQFIDLLERYDLIFSLDLSHNPLTEDSLLSLVNMLHLKSGFSQIVRILACLYDILELEISSPSSCSRHCTFSLPSHPSPIIGFLLKSSLIQRLEIIHINFHSSKNMLRLIGKLLALLGQHQLHFPLYGKKKSTLLSRILADIFSQQLCPNDLSNYCFALDALCFYKIRFNDRILEDYSSCLSKMKTEPKNFRLACELFGLILATDWSSHGAFFRSKVLSSSSFLSPSSPPPSSPSIISSLSRSFSRSITRSLSRSLSMSSPSTDATPFIQLILNTSLSCFDYHLKVIPRHFSSRRYFIQMASHAYRTVFLSFDSQTAPNFIFSAIAPFQDTILFKMQTLHEDLSVNVPPGNGCETDNYIRQSVRHCLCCLETAALSSAKTTSSFSDSSGSSQEGDREEEFIFT
jgi:hypothetical protein